MPAMANTGDEEPAEALPVNPTNGRRGRHGERPGHTKYPRGSVLRCACGEFVGRGQALGGHRASHPFPVCQDRPDIIRPEDVAEAMRLADQAKTEREERERPPPQEKPPPLPRTPRTPPWKATGSNGRDHSSNGSGRMVRVNTPRPARGDDTPAHTVHSYEVRLPSTSYTYYEFAQSDPNLGFEGSFDQFVAQCIPALFKILGYELAMIRTVPALPQVVGAGEEVAVA